MSAGQPQTMDRAAEEILNAPDNPPFAVSITDVGAEIFQQIVEASPHGVIVVDGDAQIVLVNRGTERLFGYARAELIGQMAEKLIPQWSRAGHSADHDLTDPGFAADGTSREIVALRKDGKEVPIELDIRALQTVRGPFILVSIVDVEDRRSAEARFRVAVEASPHGMLMSDPHGRIVLVNRELERVFGYRRAELLGQSVELLVPMEVRTRHPALRSEFQMSPRSRSMGAGRDLFGRRKDGSQIPLEIALNPIEMDGGIFVLASVVDIGPRKKAEEELRRSNEDLERFAYVASHDLQEPLRTVTSYVQLLSRRYADKLGPDAAEFIGFAVAGATRMQRLIEDLLAFSRVGTQRRALQPHDANVVLQAALDDLRASIAVQEAQVTSDPLPRVLVDEAQLEQLFTNLIGNALKFRGNEPSCVHIGARRDGRFWQFFVRDNGVGIDPKYFEKIFVIFQRLHARDQYEGTGVGLAISKKVVERHGGRIWVESAPGKGATFNFTLPAVPEDL